MGHIFFLSWTCIYCLAEQIKLIKPLGTVPSPHPHPPPPQKKGKQED